MTLRETRVLTRWSSLVDSLLDDFDVVDLLTELTERCAGLLDVAVGRIPARRPAAPTSSAGRHLRAGARYSNCFSCRPSRGRAWTATQTGEPVSVADIGAEIDRWPRFARGR